MWKRLGVAASLSCVQGRPFSCGTAGDPKKGKIGAAELERQQIVRRIRKLRWLGMDAEARKLEATLHREPNGEHVLLLPANTD